MNRIILIGVIGRDPEARGANKDIITTSLAVDSFSKGEKSTDWFNLVAFGERGADDGPCEKGEACSHRG